MKKKKDKKDVNFNAGYIAALDFIMVYIEARQETLGNNEYAQDIYEACDAEYDGKEKEYDKQ